MMQPMNKMDFFPEILVHINDFELQDFIENPNFDHQFMNLIHGENEDPIMNGAGFVDNTFLSCPTNPSDLCNNNSVNSSLGSFSCFDGEFKGEEENDGEDSSSATTTTTITTRSKTKPDRSKTLISERKRRGRMKDRLYALRALVPNITKMDKASIIGDAASYVNELQSQAKKLKAEIAGLEASLAMSKKYQGSVEKPMKDIHFSVNNGSICKKIFQMDMFQVDEGSFYVKLVCNKGKGVAASLYRSLDSLRGFNVQNSNLSTVFDRFLLTFSLNVKGSEPEINLPNMKLWVIGVFLNQGFEFIPFSLV